MDPNAAIGALGLGKLFERLTDDALGLVVDHGTIENFAEGRLLVEESQENTKLFVILSGRFEVFLPHTAERFSKLRLATIGPGECIGEYSFIDHHPASASVVAMESSTVLAIGHADFQRLLQSDDAIGRTIYENLLRLLIARLRQEIHSLDLFRPLG